MIRNLLFAALLLPLAIWAEDQATFLDVGVNSILLRGQAGIGGNVALQMGVNSRTDFELRALAAQAPNATVNSSGEAKDLLKVGAQFISWYTPYFGQIRPQFGGHLGAIYQKGGDINNTVMDLGLNARAIFCASDRWRFYLEGSWQAGFGKDGDISENIGAGLMFRIGK